MVNKFSPNIRKDFIQNPMQLGNDAYSSSYITYKGPNPVTVDRVYVTCNNESDLLIKLITMETRIPELGDKFSSRHG